MTVKYVRMIKERLPPAVLQEVITIKKYVQDRLTWTEPVWFGLANVEKNVEILLFLVLNTYQCG